MGRGRTLMTLPLISRSVTAYVLIPYLSGKTYLLKPGDTSKQNMFTTFATSEIMTIYGLVI